MKKLVLVIAILALSGCAEIQQQKQQAMIQQQRAELSTYVDTNRPKVNAGDMKWSEYYRGLFDIYGSSSFSDRGFMMQALVDSIEKATAFEGGKITAEEFEQFRMRQQANIAAYQETSAKDDEDRRMRALQAIAISNANRPPITYQPVQPVKPYQIQIPKSTNCTSHKVGNTVHTNCY